MHRPQRSEMRNRSSHIGDGRCGTHFEKDNDPSHFGASLYIFMHIIQVLSLFICIYFSCCYIFFYYLFVSDLDYIDLRELYDNIVIL